MFEKYTINEYLTLLNEGRDDNEKFDYLTVSAVIKFFVKLGVIKETGESKSIEGQRGKPSKVYSIPNCWEFEFWQDETKAGNPVDSVDTSEKIV